MWPSFQQLLFPSCFSPCSVSRNRPSERLGLVNENAGAKNWKPRKPVSGNATAKPSGTSGGNTAESENASVPMPPAAVGPVERANAAAEETANGATPKAATAGVGVGARLYRTEGGAAELFPQPFF